MYFITMITVLGKVRIILVAGSTIAWCSVLAVGWSSDWCAIGGQRSEHNAVTERNCELTTEYLLRSMIGDGSTEGIGGDTSVPS